MAEVTDRQPPDFRTDFVQIADRLAQLGLILPQPPRLPPGTRLPFKPVRVVGDRAFVSGHGPLHPDGSFVTWPGRVGAEITPAQACAAARLTGLAILASLERELGTLDRITAWCRVFGMVLCAPGFRDAPSVINGCSDLILDVFGPERGQHARSAVGVAELPFGIAVEVEAEVQIQTSDAALPARG
jgi:enamine deaminase RidA (YjgF/YER057c/UK114 family)